MAGLPLRRLEPHGDRPRHEYLRWLHQRGAMPLGVTPGYILIIWLIMLGVFFPFLDLSGYNYAFVSKAIIILLLPIFISTVTAFIFLPQTLATDLNSDRETADKIKKIRAGDIISSLRLFAFNHTFTTSGPAIIYVTSMWSSKLGYERLDILKIGLLIVLCVAVCWLIVELGIFLTIKVKSHWRSTLTGYFVFLPLFILIFALTIKFADLHWGLWFEELRVYPKDVLGIQITPYLFENKLPPLNETISDIWYLLHYLVIFTLLAVTTGIRNHKLMKSVIQSI